MNEALKNHVKINFGLNDYQAKVLSSLYTYGKMTASEINKKSEVPRPRVYDICEELISKKLIKSIPRKKVVKFKDGSYKKEKIIPKTYESLDFEKSIKSIEIKLKKEVEERIKYLKKNKDFLIELIKESRIM